MDLAIEQLVSARKLNLILLSLEMVNHKAVLDLYKILNKNNFDEIDVVLQTYGGDIDAAFNIIKLLRKFVKKVNIIVPLYAKSAGTLICFGADQLLFTHLSELGPLDTQIQEHQDGSNPKYISALNGFKALEQVRIHNLESLDIAIKLILTRSGLKVNEAIQLATDFSGKTSGTLYSQVDPKKIGEYARALDVAEKYAYIILTRFMGLPNERAKDVAMKFVKNYPSHGFIIDHDEILSYGLPVKMLTKSEIEIVDKIGLNLISINKNLVKLYKYSEKKVEKTTKSIVNNKKKTIKGEKNAS